MQKLTASSKIIDYQAQTAFVSHLSALFLIKVVTKAKNMFTHKQQQNFKFFKRKSANTVGNSLKSCSKGATSQQHRGLVGLSESGVVGKGENLFLVCSSPRKIAFSAIEIIAEKKTSQKIQKSFLEGHATD